MEENQQEEMMIRELRQALKNESVQIKFYGCFTSSKKN